MKKNDMEMPDDLEFLDDSAEETVSEANNEDADFADDLDLEGNISVNPKKALIFAGIFALAIVICIPLWLLTHNHLEKQEGSAISTEDVMPTESSEAAESSETTGFSEAAEPSETTGPSETEEPSEDTGSSEAAETSEATEPAKVPEPSEAAPEEPVSPEGGSAANGPVDSDASMKYTESNDSVTAKDVTNLRKAPTTSDEQNVVGQLKNGEVLNRKGFNDATGWSVLEYNGQTVYAVTGYLTTDLSYKTPVAAANPNRVSTLDGRVIIFTDCDDYVTPKEYVNLRTEPSTSEGDSTVRVQVNNGEKMHRTGYSPDSGWSRVEYNGETLYVVSSLTMNVEAQ